MNQKTGDAFNFITTGLGARNELLVIGLGGEDGLPYLAYQDSSGDWYDAGRLLKAYQTSWSALTTVNDSKNFLQVIGLGRKDGLPYRVWQDDQGAWHDSGRLIQADNQPWTELAAGKSRSNLLQVIGLGRDDGLPYLIAQDDQGTWRDGGKLIATYSTPWSTLVTGNDSAGLLQVIGLGRSDGLPYLISQDEKGIWHDAGLLMDGIHSAWSALVTGNSESKLLQVIGLERDSGLPTLISQDPLGGWKDRSKQLGKSQTPWQTLVALHTPGIFKGLQVIGLGREDGLPYRIEQDILENWHSQDQQHLDFYDLRFQKLIVGAGSANKPQVIGLGSEDGLPYLLRQDDRGDWVCDGLLPFGEKNLDRPLKPGEVLLFSKASYEGRQRLVTKGTRNLERYFPVASLRMGPRTGVTIYVEKDHQGLSQVLTSELASFETSRLKLQNPLSLDIWSTVGKPFTGYWAIEVTPMRYLSVQAAPDGVGMLRTNPKVFEREAFHIEDRKAAAPKRPVPGRRAVTFSVRGSPFVKAGISQPPHRLTIDDLAALTLVEEPEAGYRKFSLLDENNQWICYQANEDCFLTTAVDEERTIFSRSIQIAEDESQVGELFQGEAALFENPGYWGKAWVFSADYPDFDRIENLNNEVSSIILGPLTGATIYREAQFSADDPQAGKQDIITNLPSLAEEQVGENQVSSIGLWRIVPPAGLGITIQCHLSQDYRGTNQQGKEPIEPAAKEEGKFQEYTAYRTTIRVPPTVESVEVWTTDKTVIEVENKTYPVDENQPVTLHPNLFQSLVITTDAMKPPEGEKPRVTLRAPGLKIRTNLMQPHERIVIYPDQEVHARLRDLKEDELWDAKVIDKSGKEQPLVKDRSEQKKVDIANSQIMVKKVMSTVKYDSVAAGGWSQLVTPEGLQENGWRLDFFNYRVTADTLYVRAGPGIGYKPIGFLRRNEVVIPLQFNADASWMRFRRLRDGLTGWSSFKYLDQISGIPELPSEDRYRVTVAQMHVREGPGIEFRSVGVIRLDETVTVLAVNDTGTWKQIRRDDGLTGWSSARYLVLVQPPLPPAERGLAAREIPKPFVQLTPELPGLTPEVRFSEISKAEIEALLASAESPDTDLAQGWADEVIGAVKSAVSVVVAQVENGLAIIVTTAGKIIKRIADTAQKVVAFVEGIFGKIGIMINDVIDWLKFVFNWQDIIDVKDYLSKYILKSLDYIDKPFLDKIKEPVKQFFKSSKDTIDDMFDNMISAMGVEPHQEAEKPSVISEIVSAIESSGISDTLEWIVSKIMGGGTGTPTPAFATSGDGHPPASAGDLELAKFWDNTIVKGLESIVSIPEDIADIIITLVKNPGQPLVAVGKLLAMVRDQLTGLVGIGEGIILGLIDLVVDLIVRIKKMITADIRVPFISDILEWLGKDPITFGFSLLDAVTLVVAVPFTVISKALFHEVPFKNVPVYAHETIPDIVGKGFYTASYVFGAFGTMVSTVLDTMTAAETARFEQQIKRVEEFGIDPRLLVEWISWSCSLGSFLCGLVADQLMTETPEQQPVSQASLQVFAESALPWYEAFLLFLDVCTLEYQSASETKRARLRRHDDKLAVVCTILGVTHILLFAGSEKALYRGFAGWGEVPGALVTLADIVTTLPDATAFLLTFTTPPLTAIFVIGMIAMSAHVYPPVYKWFIEPNLS